MLHFLYNYYYSVCIHVSFIVLYSLDIKGETAGFFRFSKSETSFLGELQ